MLIVRYSDDSGVELAGTPEALEALAEGLDSFEPSIYALVARPPQPYDRSLAQIDLRPASGPLRLAVAGDELSVAGDESAFRTLAENIRFFVRDNPPDDFAAHLHIEWFPGNAYISEDSDPLVLRFVEPAERERAT